MDAGREPPRIAGPVAQPKKPRVMPPPGAWDSHAHVFGPADKFPYAPGRGYTPPDAPVEKYLALLDRLGCAHGLVVQGNAHGYDNRVVLDAITRFPQRLRGVAITDARVKPEMLREWHRLGMRGLRFHLLPEDPGYVRGVGLNVFEVFRKTMAELGWVMQLFCDHRVMQDVAPTLRAVSREMPVIVDHMLMVPAGKGVNEPNFQALLKLVGEGHAHVKVSAAYRLFGPISRLSRREAVPRRAAARQSRAADVGHRLAASVGLRRGDAGRRPFAGLVHGLDARRNGAAEDPGGDAGRLFGN